MVLSSLNYVLVIFMLNALIGVKCVPIAGGEPVPKDGDNLMQWIW